jgi:hypothetical protein
MEFCIFTNKTHNYLHDTQQPKCLSNNLIIHTKPSQHKTKETTINSIAHFNAVACKKWDGFFEIKAHSIFYFTLTDYEEILTAAVIYFLKKIKCDQQEH